MKNKIIALAIVFGFEAILHLFNGISSFYSSASYGEYGDAFIKAGIFAYLGYSIFYVKRKDTYWFAVIFSALVLFRSVVATAILIYSAAGLSTDLLAAAIINSLLFGILPLFILWDKEIRQSFSITVKK